MLEGSSRYHFQLKHQPPRDDFGVGLLETQLLQTCHSCHASNKNMTLPGLISRSTQLAGLVLSVKPYGDNLSRLLVLPSDVPKINYALVDSNNWKPGLCFSIQFFLHLLCRTLRSTFKAGPSGWGLGIRMVAQANAVGNKIPTCFTQITQYPLNSCTWHHTPSFLTSKSFRSLWDIWTNTKHKSPAERGTSHDGLVGPIPHEWLGPQNGTVFLDESAPSCMTSMILWSSQLQNRDSVAIASFIPKTKKCRATSSKKLRRMAAALTKAALAYASATSGSFDTSWEQPVDNAVAVLLLSVQLV